MVSSSRLTRLEPERDFLTLDRLAIFWCRVIPSRPRNDERGLSERLIIQILTLATQQALQRIRKRLRLTEKSLMLTIRANEPRPRIMRSVDKDLTLPQLQDKLAETRSLGWQLIEPLKTTVETRATL